MELVSCSTYCDQSSAEPAAGGVYGNGLGSEQPPQPVTSANGFMKPGLPPKSAAPNELRKLGVSPRFCNWPSSASRLKYIPKPARMENLCAPASPMSPCGPPLGD